MFVNYAGHPLRDVQHSRSFILICNHRFGLQQK